MGENGAGKNTLLKILSGDLMADEGQITLIGVPMKFDSPHDALQAGISVIYSGKADPAGPIRNGKYLCGCITVKKAEGA
jgi:ABC-type Na+ transport system ATPase subunit NatA